MQHLSNISITTLLLFTSNYNIYLSVYSGFVKFLGPYYMVIITRRRKIGTICGHEIYSVGKSEMIAIPSVIVWPNVAYSRDENRSFIFSSTCKYCVLPVVIPSVVLNITNNASLLCSVHFIALLFIYLIVAFFPHIWSHFGCYVVLRHSWCLMYPLPPSYCFA